jgi:hypothetical protein
MAENVMLMVCIHAKGETEKNVIYHNVSDEAIFIPEDAKF